MSDCWSKNTNSRNHRTAYPQSRHWYAWLHAPTRAWCTPPLNTQTLASNPTLALPLSVKGKCHPSCRMHGVKDYSHFSQSWPKCSGWLSYLGDGCGRLFAYKWQSLPRNLLSPWLKECDERVTDRVQEEENAELQLEDWKEGERCNIQGQIIKSNLMLTSLGRAWYSGRI